jgi:hypothetical protein
VSLSEKATEARRDKENVKRMKNIEITHIYMNIVHYTGSC